MVKHSACKHKDLSSIARMNVGRKNKTHQAHQNKLTISVLGWQGKADPWDLLTSTTNLVNSRSVRGLSQKTEGSQPDSTFGKALSAQAGGAGLEPQNPCNKLSLVVYACNPRAGDPCGLLAHQSPL